VSTVDAAPGGKSTGRTIGAVILAIVAILFIIAGIIYLAEPAKSLPSVLGQVHNSTGHRPLRAAGSLIVGVIFAVGAWFTLAYKPKSQSSSSADRESSPAGRP
jgi:amino acid permease